MDVPPLHLINLDRSVERLRSFGEWNAHLGKVERVPATDGATLSRSDLVQSGHIAAVFSAGPGTLGCSLSHIKLWEKAAKENHALTIFEDDIIASHHFLRAASRVMTDLPADWDLVKWGWTPNLGGWIDIGGARVKLQGDGTRQTQDIAELKSFQANASASAPVSMLQSSGLFAYSISPAGARAALQYCLPLGPRTVESPGGGCAEAAGFDEILAGAFPRLRAFLCMPSLVLHSYRDESVRMKLDRNG